MTDAEIIKALECCAGDEVGLCHICPLDGECNGDINILLKYALDLINRLQADKEALIAGQETLQKALAEKNEEFENQSQNFKVLVSDHRCLQQSFDHLKGLYEAEKARGEMAKKKCIGFAKELQTAKAELKETTEKFNCQQYVYTDLSDIIKEKNAEIERLNKEVDRLSQIVLYHDGHIADARAEAIKEFAKRLKKRGFADKHYEHESIVYVADIDNLVKEMVGETE